MNMDTNIHFSSVQSPPTCPCFSQKVSNCHFPGCEQNPLGMQIVAPLAVQHFMEKAKLPTFERKAINSTVLGALPLYSAESCDSFFFFSIFSGVFQKCTFLCQLPQLFDFLIQKLKLYQFEHAFQLSDMEVRSDLLGAKWTKKDSLYCWARRHGSRGLVSKKHVNGAS